MRRAVAVRFVLALACACGVQAQTVQSAGAVTGQIRDFAGQGIPGTTVILTNTVLDVRKEMFTTDDGLFNAPHLVPDAGYVLKISRKGFKDVQVDNLEVVIGRITSIRVTLQEDNSNRPVTGGPPVTQVDDTREGVADVTYHDQVEDLPSPDRNLDPMAAKGPAVTRSPNSGVLYPFGEPWTNASLLDGIYTTHTHWLLQPQVEPDIKLDHVNEMQVLTGAPPMSFSHTMGSVVDTLSNTIGGRVHGSAYDYFTDDSFDAKSRFAPKFTPHGHQHQAGGDAGGSIFSNTMFWFVSFDGIRGSDQGINLLTNPLLANSTGTGVSTANCTATVAQCNAAANFLNAQLNKVVNRSLSSMNPIAKLDYHLTEDQTFYFEVGGLHRNAPNGSEAETVSTNSGLLGYNGSLTEETRLAKAGWNSQMGGRANNDARVTWFRDRFSDYADPALLPVTGALGINVAGTPFGGNPNYPMAVSQQNRSIIDSFQISAASHTIRLGVEYVRGEDWTDQVYNRAGTYDYPSLTAFATDFSGNAALRKNYTTFTQRFGNPLVDLTTAQYNFFAGDTWKITRHLQVSVGVHYERIRLPKPLATSPDYYQTGNFPSPDKDAGPHFGATYLLNNKTVLRLGAGEYFQPYVGQFMDAIVLGNGLVQPNLTLNASQTGAGAPVYPKILPITNLPAGGQNIVYSVSRMRNPYNQQATLGIERSVTRGTTVSLSYLYVRGRSLFTATDLNLNPSTVSQTYTILNTSGGVAGTFTTPLWTSRANPNYAHVYEIENNGRSRYEGASIQIRQRLTHGVAVDATYTWSDATSTTNGPLLPQLGFAVPAQTYLGNVGADQAHTPYWQRNRAVINWILQPNVPHGSPWIMRAVANGWQFNGIVALATGLRQTPVALLAGQQFSGVSMSYLTSLNGSGGWNRVPFLGIGDLPTPSERLVNLRVSRTFPVTERAKATLMFEGFNVFNHQYATSVNTVAYTALNGILKPAPGLGAPNAANDYPFGDNARHLQVAVKITF